MSLPFNIFSFLEIPTLSRLEQQVALKIVKADSSKNNNELSVLLHLSGLNHPGKKHIIELLDHFEHDGPNGNHLCLGSLL